MLNSSGKNISEHFKKAKSILLKRISNTFANTLNLEDLLVTVTDGIVNDFGYTGSMILTNDERHNSLILNNVSYDSKIILAVEKLIGFSLKGHRFRIDKDEIYDFLYNNRKPLLTTDILGMLKRLTIHEIKQPVVAAIVKLLKVKSAILLPLAKGDNFLGLLVVASKDYMNEKDLKQLESFAEQSAVVMEKAKLIDDERKKVKELYILNSTLLEITSQTDLNRLLKTIIEKASELLEAEAGDIYLYDRKKNRLVLEVATSFIEKYLKFELKPGEGLAGKVYESGKSLKVNDYRVWEGRAKIFDKEKPFTAVMGVPLVWHGKVIGVLSLNADKDKRTFTNEDIWLVKLFADQAAIAVENARLFTEAKESADAMDRKIRELELLHDFSQIVIDSTDLNFILRTVIRQIVILFKADHGGILMFDMERGYGKVLAEFPETGTLNIEYPIRGYRGAEFIIKEKKPLFVEDTLKDPIMESVRDTLNDLNIKSMLIVPLVAKDEVFGSIGLDAIGKKRKFREDEIKLAQTIANQVAIAVRNANLYNELMNSEKRYRMLVQSSDDLIFSVNREGLLLTAGGKNLEMAGLSPEAAIGKSLFDIFTKPEAKSYKKHIDEVFDRGESVTYTYEFETENQRKITQKTIYPIFEHEKGITSVGVISRDITKQKILEEQLLHAQKMQTIGTLAGGIAHDFNTILAGIMGYSTLMENQLSPEDPVSSDLRTIIKLSKRAADLTAQLLAFAQGGRYEMKPVDLHSIIGEVVDLLSHTIDKSIVIETKTNDEPAIVEGDPSQLQQMLLNLCLNASDAMKDGGKLIIETKSAVVEEEYIENNPNMQPGKYIRVVVSDTGCGMDENTKKRIFEPFFTTKANQPGKKHSGLGMSMIYGIVHGHKGEIYVHSKPGKGTKIEVFLPQSEEVVVESRERNRGLLEGNETILVVDDEENVRSMLKRLISRKGYTVILASNGNEAIEIYKKRKNEIALIILDLIMPGLSGKATFKAIRSIDPEAKVLLSSGYSKQGEAKDLLELGVKGFLQKPYEIDQLLMKIRDVLGK